MFEINIFIVYVVIFQKHNQALFEKLCEDLDQEYSMAVNKECVYLPEKGKLSMIVIKLNMFCRLLHRE